MNIQVAKVLAKLIMSELELLYNYWSEQSPPKSPNIKILPEVCMVEQQRGVCCPYCKSNYIKKHGYYRGGRCYICKSCSHSFNDLTGTPFAWIHDKSKMLNYMKNMIQYHTLRDLSKMMHICLDTSFNWRHKILFAFSRKENDHLEGICEADETFFKYSEKGSREVKTHRKPHKRGGVATKRGVSNELVPVIVSCDRKHNVICRVAGRGRITSRDIEDSLGNYIENSSILCTDVHNSYILYAKTHYQNHQILNIS